MFRKSIFFGLMVLLGSVLLFMILSGRKEEKRRVSPPAEIVRQSKPSATRVLSPADLRITRSTMEILHPPVGSGLAAGVSARHAITLRNQGSRAYKGFMLRLSYLGASGSRVEDRSRQVTQQVPAGETVQLQEVLMEGLPGRVRSCNVAVLWADLSE